MIFGKIASRMTYAAFSPRAQATSTKSSAFTLIASARLMRKAPGVKITMVPISTGIEEPSAATTTSADILLWIEISASKKRLSTMSTDPRETAASMPSVPPNTIANKDAAAATPIE